MIHGMLIGTSPPVYPKACMTASPTLYGHEYMDDSETELHVDRTLARVSWFWREFFLELPFTYILRIRLAGYKFAMKENRTMQYGDKKLPRYFDDISVRLILLTWQTIFRILFRNKDSGIGVFIGSLSNGWVDLLWSQESDTCTHAAPCILL